MEGTVPVFVACVGGSHDGHAMPMPPHALEDGHQLVVPPHAKWLALMDAPESDPVPGRADRSWERYVMHKTGDTWVFEYDGNLDHLDPPPGLP
jgi:hypothetical protein